jgi:membrane-associated phospholipid phosphatase
VLAWVIYAVGLAIAIAAGAGLAGPLASLVRRATEPGVAASDALVRGYGRLVAFLVALCVGTGATLVVGMIVGVAARAFGTEDWRFFHWVSGQQTHALTQLMKVLTQIGGTLEMRITAVVVGVILVALKPRFAWVTVLALFSVMALQFELAQILGLAIHRGHPPVGHGTYPSGGVSRLVALPGVILLLVTRYWPPSSPWVARAGWAVVALLGWTELYSRVYLGKHFVSDSVGGAIFGVMLIITVGLAIGVAMSNLAPAARTSGSRPWLAPGVGQESAETRT